MLHLSFLGTEDDLWLKWDLRFPSQSGPSSGCDSYAFLGKTSTESSNMVTTNVISICYQMVYVLFDLGSIYSYVYVQFVMGVNLVFDILDYPIYVPTLVREPLVVTHFNCSCPLLFVEFLDFG